MPVSQDGVPAQIHRRVTLVRSSSSVREDTVGVPSAQQPAAEPSSRSDGEPPKRKKAKAAQQGSQQADTKELRLEDIVVKQVCTAMCLTTTRQWRSCM